jgi:hypothetical protein
MERESKVSLDEPVGGRGVPFGENGVSRFEATLGNGWGKVDGSGFPDSRRKWKFGCSIKV